MKIEKGNMIKCSRCKFPYEIIEDMINLFCHLCGGLIDRKNKKENKIGKISLY